MQSIGASSDTSEATRQHKVCVKFPFKCIVSYLLINSVLMFHGQPSVSLIILLFLSCNRWERGYQNHYSCQEQLNAHHISGRLHHISGRLQQ